MNTLLLSNGAQNPNLFQVLLLKPLDLTRDKWTVSFVRLFIQNEKVTEPLYVYCSLVECALMGSTFGSLLDVVNKDMEQLDGIQPLKRPAIQEYVTSVQVHITGQEFDPNVQVIAVVTLEKS